LSLRTASLLVVPSNGEMSPGITMALSIVRWWPHQRSSGWSGSLLHPSLPHPSDAVSGAHSPDPVPRESPGAPGDLGWGNGCCNAGPESREILIARFSHMRFLANPVR
jgi:hypothetical protein